MQSSDIGSLPARASGEKIASGAAKANTLLPLLGVESGDYDVFRSEVAEAFIDKLKAGVDVPNYPQFRDMNEMFLNLIEGYERAGGALFQVAKIRPRNGAAIPEVLALKQEAKRVTDEADVDRVNLKICVTGPYTLASFFQTKNPRLFTELGDALTRILEASIFSNRRFKTVHVCVDEPVLGFLNDPLLDYGSDGRESLRKAWDALFGKAAQHGADTSIHLHDTSENLFWDIEHLDMVSSHVGDLFYDSESTKKRLEETDKTLWAPISVTQYDTLIEAKLRSEGTTSGIPELIGEVWTRIRNKEVDPLSMLEPEELLRKRLRKLVQDFGEERISYYSPECGLLSFPDYGSAMECLRRTSNAAQSL